MTTEQRVRDALHDVAAAYSPPSGGWDEIQRRHRSSRRSQRRPVFLAAVAAAAAVAIALLMTGLFRDEEPDSLRVVDQPPVEMPAEIVAAVRQDAPAAKLVVVDSKSGEVQRTLVEAGQHSTGMPHFIVSAVDLSPDRKWVYYAETAYQQNGQSGPELIKRVPFAGGEPETVVEGTAPSVSPDNLLAYIRPNGTEVAVRDLDTGDDTVWAEFDEQFFNVDSPFVWAPDSSAFVFQPFLGHTVWLVNPEGVKTVLAPAQEDEESRPTRLAWTPFFLSDGRLAVVASDFDLRWKDGQPVGLGEALGMRVDALDDSGEPLETMVVFAEDQNLGEGEGIDVSGDHVLWTLREGDGFVRWTIGTKPVTVALRGVEYAAW